MRSCSPREAVRGLVGEVRGLLDGVRGARGRAGRGLDGDVMGRADDPRIYVRCKPGEFEAIERAARVAGVSNGSLVRECALRWGPVLAAAIASGDREDIRSRLRGRGERP